MESKPAGVVELEFTCTRCGGRVLDGQCESCQETYITMCPRCGNSITFEQVAVGNEIMLRCTACENDSDLQMVALHPF